MSRASSGVSVGKESACNAGATGDAGLISGLGRSLEEGMATHSSMLAWRISWTESMGSQSQKTEHACLTKYAS